MGGSKEYVKYMSSHDFVRTVGEFILVILIYYYSIALTKVLYVTICFE